MSVRSSLSLFRWLGPLALVACTGGTAPTASTDAGTTADTSDGPRDMLIVAAGSDINNMLPVVSSSASDSAVFGHIYMEGLDGDFDCELNYKPALYESWEWSDDSLSLTMTLREGVKWADGTPVTAQDIAFTNKLFADPDVASPRFGFTQKHANPPEAIGTNKVKFTWVQPGDRITRLAESSAYHVPKHLLDTAAPSGLRTHPLTTDPVGTGPFMLTKRKPNAFFTLEPNPNFTGPDNMKPRLKMVRFEIVPEYQTRLLKLKKGEVDLAEGIQVKDADDLRENNPNLKLVSRGYRFMDYIAWNLSDPRFQDVRVRQAMAYAVDIDGMIKRLLTGGDGTVYAKQAYGTITPEICSTRAEIELIKQNVDKAKSLLAEAGWTDTNSNGIVDKGGQELEFTLITNRENERRMQAAQLVQSGLKEIGVNMKLDFVEFNSMSDRARRKEFEAMLGGWAAGLYVNPAAMWHSGPEYTFNYPGYSNAEVDRLIDTGLATPDPKEAGPIWKEMQEKVYADQPYLFLWWRDEIVAVDKRFENTSIDITSLTHRLYEWEVPADKVKYDL